MVLFPKIVLSALIMRFLSKKSEKFKVGKVRKYDEEGVFFGKQTFSSF